MTDRLLRLREIIGDPKAEPPILPIIPKSKSQLYREIAGGVFPKPVKLGARSVAWRESDIEAYLASLSSGG